MADIREKVMRISIQTVQFLIRETREGDTVDLMVALENVVVGVVMVVVKRGYEPEVVKTLFDGVLMRIRKQSGQELH